MMTYNYMKEIKDLCLYVEEHGGELVGDITMTDIMKELTDILLDGGYTVNFLLTHEFTEKSGLKSGMISLTDTNNGGYWYTSDDGGDILFIAKLSIEGSGVELTIPLYEVTHILVSVTIRDEVTRDPSIPMMVDIDTLIGRLLLSYYKSHLSPTVSTLHQEESMDKDVGSEGSAEIIPISDYFKPSN